MTTPFTTVEFVTDSSIKITTRVGTHLEEQWINTSAPKSPVRFGRIVAIEGSTGNRSSARGPILLTIEADVDLASTHVGDILPLAIPAKETP